MSEYMPKFYTLEDMTQEDLNKLALERNTFASEIERLNNIINELEKDVENKLMSIPDDMCDDGLEEIKRTTKIAVYQVVLGKLKELKGDSSNE